MTKEQLRALAEQMEALRKEYNDQMEEQNRSAWLTDQVATMEDLLQQYESGMKTVQANERTDSIMNEIARQREDAGRSQGVHSKQSEVSDIWTPGND